jgi:RNA polymerase sigma factor (sigma-70 family)
MHNGTPDAGLARIAADPDALETFYRRHVSAVSSFIARRVDDPYLVADLTAEIFIAAIGSAHTYQPGRGTHRGWLYGIARNVLASDRRRTARELDAAGRFAGRRLLDDDDIARLEERIDAESAARRARAALAGLPADERAVLELVAIDGLAVQDAAAALGIQPGTARVRLHRARRAAKSALRFADPADAQAPGPHTSHPAGAAGQLTHAKERR